MQERARDVHTLMFHEAGWLAILSRVEGLVLGLGGTSIDTLWQDHLWRVRFEAARGLDLIWLGSHRTLHSFVHVKLATER